jgi:hypothetical protein
MFVFACPITARSQSWLFAPRAIRGKYPYLPSNIRIGSHISVFAPRILLPVSAQWSQILYVQSTRKDGMK